MPRDLPAALTSALDSGTFTAYVALGKRNYDATPPTALVDYTTLITNILYYKYDGLELTIKYASPNLPATDGLIVGNRYYIERGVLISGSPVTIKSASLRFDDYEINRQVITAYFSLYSPDEKPAAVDGDDTYTNVLTALNPNAYWLGTVDFLATPENAYHWEYQFYPAGKQAIPKSYASFLPHIRQKYLIQAVDNSDNTNEDEVQYYHLRTPIDAFYWFTRSTQAIKIYGIAYSQTLDLYVACGVDASNVAYIQTSDHDGIIWNPAEIAELTFDPRGIAWSPSLAKFAMCGVLASGANAVAYSSDGSTWTEAASPNTLYDMAWSDDLGLFVAMGRYIATSPDGINWTERTNPTTNTFQSVVWSAELATFVAVSSGGGAGERVLTSPDGITWTERTAAAANSWMEVCWSADLTLFVAVSEDGTQRVMTSPDGITWTGRDHAEAVLYESVAWSSYYSKFYAVAYEGNLMYSTDGITWVAEAAPDGASSVWRKIIWSPDTYAFIIGASGGTYNIVSSVSTLVVDHEITQGDIVLYKNANIQAFLWRDEGGTIHLTGETSSIVHNLGYLESTDDPPASYTNSERGKVSVGIHLKYKSGDVFKLAINASQYSTYMGKVTEVLDPNADIGWRCDIELIERFENTVAGALPSTIERIAAYTPLVTVNFNNNLDSTVNNLQAFADRVDDMTFSISGGGLTWMEVTTDTEEMAINYGYIANKATAVTFTIPETAPVGSIVRVVGRGAGGWIIAQHASEYIIFGNKTTTTGIGGSLGSVNQYDCIELVCIVENTAWAVVSSIGNITVA